MHFQTTSIRSINRLISVIAFTIALFIFFPNSASAIVNGVEASEDVQPWMVGIAQANVEDGYYAQFCGGTLISSEWVLTAAHCTFDETGAAFNASDLDVIIGRHQLSSKTGERIQVDQIVRNAAYEATTYHNDIALLHLSRPSQGAPVTLVLPVRSDLEQPTATATVAGWGVTASGEATDKLQQAELPIASTAVCQTAYANLGLTLTDNTLCAGYAEGGIDACDGDSGGPLVVRDELTGRWTQIGIVSWGKGCAQAGLFGVYTRVASFSDWIAGITKIDTGVQMASSSSGT
jgi:secreted trypsin-like serine protease